MPPKTCRLRANLTTQVLQVMAQAKANWLILLTSTVEKAAAKLQVLTAIFI